MFSNLFLTVVLVVFPYLIIHQTFFLTVDFSEGKPEALDDEPFCKDGQLAEPSYATAYFSAKDEDFGRWGNYSILKLVGQRFHELVLDCPQLAHLNWDPKKLEDSPHLQTLQLFNWTLALNKLQQNVTQLKIWLRLPTHDQNTINWESLFCIRMALEGSKNSLQSVQGIIMNFEPLETALAFNRTKVQRFSKLSSIWRNLTAQFGLSLGVALSAETCFLPDLLRNAQLSQFNQVFFGGVNGGGFKSGKTGITAYVSRKFKSCESQMNTQLYNKLKIMLMKISIYPIGYNPGPLCLTYFGK